MKNKIINYLKTKGVKLLFLIDIFFYLYLIFGLISIVSLGVYVDASHKAIAISYISILIPLFILKMYKDYRSESLRKVVFDD